jgi:hypothetical protein
MIRKYRLWKLRRDARKVCRISKKIDTAMQNMGLPRYARRQIWRDIIKSADVRQEAFESLTGK